MNDKKKIHNIVAAAILAQPMRQIKQDFVLGVRGYRYPLENDDELIIKAEKAARSAMEQVLIEAPNPLSMRHENLLIEALSSINSYNGKNVVTLSTGEKALDFDDAWLLIGLKTGMPMIRDKRDQRILESVRGTEEAYQFEDDRLVDNFEVSEICEIADKLLRDEKP